MHSGIYANCLLEIRNMRAFVLMRSMFVSVQSVNTQTLCEMCMVYDFTSQYKRNDFADCHQPIQR